MVSRMAIEDLEELKEQGIDVTPEEVVRLNAFGIKVERSTESPNLSVMPRVAILGNLVFHEPTIGSEIWLGKVGRLFDLESFDTFVQLRSYSLSTPLDELVDPEDKEKIVETIKEFTKSKLSPYTYPQVMNALSYVIQGNDPVDGEDRPFKEDEEQKDVKPEEETCFEVGLMRDGILLKLGTKQELEKMSTSELQLLVEYATEMKYGAQTHKSEHSKRLGEYYLVLDEIKKAHKQ